MRFTCAASTLIEALQIVTKALPTRTPNQILEGILVETDMNEVILTCSDERMLMESAAELRQTFDEKAREEFPGVKHIVFGPFEAPVYRVDNKFRMRMIVKCVLNRDSRALFAALLADFQSSSSIKPTLSIDFNPSSL